MEALDRCCNQRPAQAKDESSGVIIGRRLVHLWERHRAEMPAEMRTTVQLCLENMAAGFVAIGVELGAFEQFRPAPPPPPRGVRRTYPDKAPPRRPRKMGGKR